MLKTALEFEVVDLPQETFAFVVRRVAPAEVGEFIQGALGPRRRVRGRVRRPAGAADGDHHRARRVRVARRRGRLAGRRRMPSPAAPVEVRTLPATRALRHLPRRPVRGARRRASTPSCSRPRTSRA